MTDNDAADTFLWLEDVLGERALGWVRARNAESLRVLQAQPDYEPIRTEMLALLDAKDRIPQISRRGDHFYNLWQDETHPRGVWRRTTLDGYRAAEPPWEEVLDLDALGAAEAENWVWGGATGLPPAHHRCLISLSRGGADAAVVREFDTVAKCFVEGGFTLPKAKSRVAWIDTDTIFVGTDTGPGSMTASGYPRTLRRWARGTALVDAPTVFQVQPDDMSAHVEVDSTPGHERMLFMRAIDFYHHEHFVLTPEGPRLIDVPGDASISFWNSAGDPADTLLIELRSHWTFGGTTHPSGALLATDAAAFLRGEVARVDVLFTPTPTCSLAGFSATRSCVIVNLLDDVASRLEEWRRGPEGFIRRPIEAPFPGSLGAAGLHDPMRGVDDPLAETWLMSYGGFLTPDSLWLAETSNDERQPLKALPARFDATGMQVDQCFTTSADGTRVPYFVIWPRGLDAGRAADGRTPTLLYGYGGFEISMQPGYRAAWGTGWLARGGALVIANIRGGGEYGPAWHQAAIKQHKQRSYDDFIAVAVDLIARGITNPEHLGIEGGSNGGLLVGAVVTQRPDLFNAVVCAVPLLDMRRYHLLLAGASWMAEYGNPDNPAEWAFISRYSPYQNARADANYPEILFTTSTRDDRVHPGHARKIAAKLMAQGHRVLYYENIEGGHGGAADNKQRAHVQALEMSYLWRQLGTDRGTASTPAPPPASVGATTDMRADATATATASGTTLLVAEAQAVLDFWFGAPGDPEHDTDRKLWFTKSEATDREIADRFGPLIERALRGELVGWATQARGALAHILLLDQFTRNAMRGTPRAFAGDPRALRSATAVVGSRQDEMLTPLERVFVYLPFEHSEGPAMQDESVRLFTRLVAQVPEMAEYLNFAERHREIIRRFGRFPHRNATLGRQSTAEEIEFLKQPGSGF